MLHDFQDKFRQAVLENDSMLLTGFADAEAARRFSIYRNNIFVSLIEVLKDAFPVTTKLVGEDNFRVLARNFLPENLPKKAQLSDYGGHFPEFICGLDHVIADIPYLPDLAKLEWLTQQVYFAAEEPIFGVVQAQSYAGEDLMGLSLKLRASCKLLKTDYSVSHFREMESLEIEILSPASEYLLIYRAQNTEMSAVEKLTKAEYEFLSLVNNGAGLLDAFEQVVGIDESFDLQNILTQSLHKAVFKSL